MASINSASSAAQILQHPVTPKSSEAVRALFDRVFTASIKATLAKPDNVKMRIDNDQYVTQLFFKDETHSELVAMFSIDKKPFRFIHTEGAMRIHFLHTNGTPGLQKPLLLKALAYAINKHAKAIIFLITPSAGGVNKLLGELKFLELEQQEGCRVMVHDKLDQLEKQLQPKPNPQPKPPAPEPKAPAPLKQEMPLPRFYKGVTLMKKYLYMIRDGRKTVEGRINRGMFAKYKIPVGSGLRFFYTQNAQDDVHCTILGVRTFDTFREMLQHYGYEKLVPDVNSLEAAVAAYAKIPGYSQKERDSGVIGIELRVDPKEPNGHEQNQAQTYQRPHWQDSGSRKRPASGGPGYGEDRYEDRYNGRSKHYDTPSASRQDGSHGSRKRPPNQRPGYYEDSRNKGDSRDSDYEDRRAQRNRYY